MFKKSIAGVVISLSIVSSLNAEVLKQDMDALESSLIAVQHGFLLNDRKTALLLLADFKKNVNKVLGSKEKVVSLLPDKLKNKSSIALNSGKMIDSYLQEIDSIANDKNLTPIKARIKAQEAFLNIQTQCFKCHNLVRDW